MVRERLPRCVAVLIVASLQVSCSSSRGVVAGDLPVPRRSVAVSSSDELGEALRDARPGDHIVLTDGPYGGFTAAQDGTGEAPVVIRAAEALQVEITGNVRLTGDYVWLAGVSFEDDSVQVTMEGTGNRLTRSRFRTDEDGVEIVSGARRATIDHNEFDGSDSDGSADKPIEVRIGRGDGNAMHRIHRNHFHDMQTGRNNNVMEIGTNGNYRHVQTGTIVEYNLISTWSTGRCVSTKSGGNIIRFNTCLDIDGEDLINRAGSNNQWIANWIEGASGDAIRVMDAGLEVIGNRIVGDGYIRVHAGDCVPPRRGLSGCSYPAATNTLLAGNVGDLRVGDGYSDYESVPARDTRIEAHTDDISYENHRDTQAFDSTDREIPKALKLSPSDVGPFAVTAPRW